MQIRTIKIYFIIFVDFVVTWTIANNIQQTVCQAHQVWANLWITLEVRLIV